MVAAYMALFQLNVRSIARELAAAPIVGVGISVPPLSLQVARLAVRQAADGLAHQQTLLVDLDR